MSETVERGSSDGLVEAPIKPHRIARGQPPGALRAVEVVGRLLAGIGVPLPALDEDALCAAARRRTGLSNFGDERFRQLFRDRIRDFQAVSHQSSLLLRLAARFFLLKGLCNRLQIEDVIMRHPEILATPVPRPIVVAGLARTGTTLLLNLLAQDPGSRTLLPGEGLSPAKPMTPRQTERFVSLLNRLLPQLRKIYIVEAGAPVECGMLFRNTFFPHDATARDVQQWRERFSLELWEWAYRQYYRQLQLLQWQRPAPDHWLLKWPQHVTTPDILVKTVPEVAIIQTHRNLAQVIPATCQMVARFGFLLPDDRWERLPRHVVELTEEMLRRSLEARQRIPAGRIFDLSYQRLMADPLGALRDVYDHFGYRYTDEFDRRVRGWLQQHPPPTHGEGYYDLEQFGLDRALLEKTFGFYYQQIGIEPDS